MNIYDLCRWIVAHGGQCCPTTEYGNFEFHNKKTAPREERFYVFGWMTLAVDDHTLGQTLTIDVDAVEVKPCFKVSNVEIQGVLPLNA